MSGKMLSRILPATLLILTSTLWAQPPAGTVIPGRFICLVDDVQDAFTIGQAAVRATGGALGHVYTNALNGFSIEVPPGIVIANLRAHPGVLQVEPDIVMRAYGNLVPTGINRIDAEGVAVTTINCSNIGIAIIDTGIDVDHPDLNVVGGRRFYTRSLFRPPLVDDNYDDDNGHGTHVAGIAAANGGVVGVAPGASLYAVKVLDSRGSGYMSDIIAGVDWVTANAKTIRVANMSLGGPGPYDPLRTAIEKSLAAGVSYVVAAGNESDDVDYYVPAAYGGMGNASAMVYTISAFVDTDGKPGGLGAATSYGADDSFASFSNFSANNRIAYVMPGVSIYSTYKGGGYTTMSGTSMASPHFAGLLALGFAGGEIGSWTMYDTSNGLIASSNDHDSHDEPIAHANYGFVAPPAQSSSMYIQAISGSATPVKNTWRATATITVGSDAGVVSGATVSGTWSTGATGSAVTGTDGKCAISVNVPNKTAAVTFTVTNIVKSGYTYDASLNPASNSITISKP